MSQYRKVLSSVTLNMSRAYSTFGNTFHVNPHVAERLYERYTSALSQDHNSPTEDSSPYLPSRISSLQLQTLIEVSFWASLIQEEGNITSFLSHYVRKNSPLTHSYLKVECHLKPHSWRNLLRHLDLKKILSAFGSMIRANWSSGDLLHQRESRWQSEHMNPVNFCCRLILAWPASPHLFRVRERNFLTQTTYPQTGGNPIYWDGKKTINRLPSLCVHSSVAAHCYWLTRGVPGWTRSINR